MLNSQIKIIITKALHENFAEFTEDKVEAIIDALTNAGFVLMPREPSQAIIDAHMKGKVILAYVGAYENAVDHFKKEYAEIIKAAQGESFAHQGGWINANNPPSFNSNDKWIITDGHEVYANFYWLEEFYDNGKHFPTGWYHECNDKPSGLSVTHYRAMPKPPITEGDNHGL